LGKPGVPQRGNTVFARVKGLGIWLRKKKGGGKIQGRQSWGGFGVTVGERPADAQERYVTGDKKEKKTFLTREEELYEKEGPETQNPG